MGSVHLAVPARTLHSDLDHLGSALVTILRVLERRGNDLRRAGGRRAESRGGVFTSRRVCGNVVSRKRSRRRPSHIGPRRATTGRSWRPGIRPEPAPATCRRPFRMLRSEWTLRTDDARDAEIEDLHQPCRVRKIWTASVRCTICARAPRQTLRLKGDPAASPAQRSAASLCASVWPRSRP